MATLNGTLPLANVAIAAFGVLARVVTIFRSQVTPVGTPTSGNDSAWLSSK
jgi:hypothetical protein